MELNKRKLLDIIDSTLEEDSIRLRPSWVVEGYSAGDKKRAGCFVFRLARVIWPSVSPKLQEAFIGKILLPHKTWTSCVTEKLLEKLQITVDGGYVLDIVEDRGNFAIVIPHIHNDLNLRLIYGGVFSKYYDSIMITCNKCGETVKEYHDVIKTAIERKSKQPLDATLRDVMDFARRMNAKLSDSGLRIIGLLQRTLDAVIKIDASSIRTIYQDIKTMLSMFSYVVGGMLGSNYFYPVINGRKIEESSIRVDWSGDVYFNGGFLPLHYLFTGFDELKRMALRRAVIEAVSSRVVEFERDRSEAEKYIEQALERTLSIEELEAYERDERVYPMMVEEKDECGADIIWSDGSFTSTPVCYEMGSYASLGPKVEALAKQRGIDEKVMKERLLHVHYEIYKNYIYPRMKQQKKSFIRIAPSDEIAKIAWEAVLKLIEKGKTRD